MISFLLNLSHSPSKGQSPTCYLDLVGMEYMLHGIITALKEFQTAQDT